MSLIEFNTEHQIFRQMVQKFVDQELRPHAMEWEQAGMTPRSVWKRAGDLGLLGITYPTEYGGMGADYLYTLIYSEEIAKCGSAGVGLGLTVQTDMATPAICKYGNSFIKETYLRPAISGEMICSVAVTEPGCGSDVAGLKTKAVKDGNDYVISGSKMFITNGVQADFLTLLARTSDQKGYGAFSLIVVPTNLAGFSRSKPMKKTCYLSSDTAEIVLDQVRVSRDHLIGEEGRGFMYQMEQFQMERLSGAFQMLGGMKHCYELTKTYIQQREAFGKKLSKFQVTQHKMAQMITEITAVECMAAMCVKKVQASEEFIREASMLKLFAAQVQQRITEECVQLHGGYGLMTEYEVARYFRDAKLAGIGGGSNEIMKEIIVKAEGLW